MNAILPNSEKPVGFNVIGLVSANAGLGISARLMVQLLLSKGYPVAIYETDPGLGRGNHDKQLEKYTVESPDDLPYQINFYAYDPPGLSWVLSADGRPLIRPDSFNVAFSMWEVTALPTVLRQTLEMFDVVVAGSDYIRSTFQRNLSNVFTLYAPHPVYIPQNVQADRERFGLPKDKTVFMCSFEPHSDPVRKNPFAVIEAFRRSLWDDPRAFLVLKLNNANAGGTFHPVVRDLLDRCAQNPRVRIITDNLSYDEVLSLYASADVYVSLHRAEGLGLGLMEAMALGKPVIATAWSGNMSYMNHTNSCLVGYKLIPVRGSILVYTQDYLQTECFWADPDIDQAARWMKCMVEDPNLRVELGRQAATDMGHYQKEAQEGRFIHEILEIWKHREFLGQNKDKAAALRSVRNAVYDQQHSYVERVTKRVRDQLDRRILWRFRKELPAS